MKNIIIMGSGRSGTSMLAGTLAKAGYFMGENLYPPRESNPKGFFESSQINGINEDILALTLPKRPPIIGKWLFRSRPGNGQRWLARVPVGKEMVSTEEIRRRIGEAVKNTPYCFKDPRFCYTLPIWRPFLKETVFLTVFRNPAVTAASILKECRQMPYLQNLSINIKGALEGWTLMHRHILQIHRRQGQWLFLHYNQALQEEGLAQIEEFTGAAADRSFPDKKLRRTQSRENLPETTRSVYQELCRLAGYRQEPDKG